MTELENNDLIRLHRHGMSQARIAQELGVAVSTVRRRLRKLGIVGRSPQALSPECHLSLGLNAVEQLAKVNERANAVLDLLTFDPEMRLRQIVEEQVQETLEKYMSTQKSGSQKKPPPIRFDFRRVTEDLKVALKAMAEIREQLKFYLDACKTLYDVQAITDFQRTVLEAIGEVDPLVRRDIIQRLKEERSAECPAGGP